MKSKSLLRSYDTVQTVCPYCGAGCGINLEVVEGRVIGVVPSKAHPVSRGRLCIKGWSAGEFIHSDTRLTKPLIRKKGELHPVSWEEALSAVAEGLSRAKQISGPRGIGILSSAKCTNEENFLLMKLARAVLKTNNIDHCARLCHASTVVGLARSLGSGAMTNSVCELEDAQCIFVIGSNTTEQHPLIATRILAAKEKGASLIVADPRKIQLASLADIHIRQQPGTDVALVNGMMNVILEEGLENHDFIEERTEGFEEFSRSLREYSPDRVEAITGVPEKTIREAALAFGQAGSASIVYSMGITQHVNGTDCVLVLANLALLTGNLGRHGAGINPLRGQNNVQGACDMGALPNVYSGYQAVANELVRGKFAHAWGSDLPSEPGLTLTEMFKSAREGSLRAMYIMGENPVLSDPDSNHVKAALEKLDFLVVQDIFLNETAAFADVILPAASYAEKEGTFTSTERRVQRVRKAIDAVGDARGDWKIICLLSKRLGSSRFDYDSPEQIFAEIAQLTPIYAGISYARLDGDGIQWPCPDPDHPGTPTLHEGRIARGKGKFSVVSSRGPAEMPDEEYPFTLLTGRSMFHFHTGTMTRTSPSLHREMEGPAMEIHPEDAEALGVHSGEAVAVTSRRGRIEVPVLITDRTEPGTVFMTFHFAESPVNVLTNPALDPDAKIPELKVCAVKVEKIELAHREEGGRK